MVMAQRLSIYLMNAIPCSQKHGTSVSSRYRYSYTFAKYRSYDYQCHYANGIDNEITHYDTYLLCYIGHRP